MGILAKKNYSLKIFYRSQCHGLAYRVFECSWDRFRQCDVVRKTATIVVVLFSFPEVAQVLHQVDKLLL